ncbi:hypothetical protein ACP3W1_26060, partial [Salmonella enterica]|uniref:hypothetical protein n=1 Tax=Salmonella enterica TaxID=28901 RepID=UPI003CEB75A0
NPNRPRIYRFVRQPAAASEGAPSERRIEGYVVLSLVLGKIPSRVHVGEWVCETADAMQSALSLLYGMRSIFQTLTWTSGPVDY